MTGNAKNESIAMLVEPDAGPQTIPVPSRWLNARRLAQGDVPDFVFYGPALILLLVFVLLPILSSFGIAFTIWDGITTPRWVGLQNFGQLFGDRSVLVAIANTL